MLPAAIVASFLLCAPPVPGAAAAPTGTTVFVAREVITMDPGWPTATCIAVQDGRILSVGRTLDDLKPWMQAASAGTVTVDETFKDKVLVPGFIEAHGHPLVGAIALAQPCLSNIPVPSPYGPAFPGVKDLDAVRVAIRSHLDATAAGAEPALFWGYDVIAMGQHLDTAWLDAVEPNRPVIVWDASEHFVYANTPAMRQRGVTDQATRIVGVMSGPDGKPNGQFLGTTAATWFLAPVIEGMLTPERLPGVMQYLVDLGWRNGVTTTSEMALGQVAGIERESELFRAFFHDARVPLRCVAISSATAVQTPDGRADPERLRAIERTSDDKLVFRGVKFFADDAFLPLGMVVENPGYTDGRKGLWITPPDAMVDAYRPWWDAGFHIHTHTNGNAGVDAVVRALRGLQDAKPRFDHRFTIQHYGMSTPENARDLATLQGLASVNPYYLHNRADLNVPYLGTDRAETSARLGTLVAAGVVAAMHTDTPVSPPIPLESIWIAVNRIGRFSGKVLGPSERITPMQALRMVTIDAAYTLGVEDKVGSIRAGKLADFTVLDRSPLEVDPMAIRDIPVWGIVVGGVKHPVSAIAPRPAAKAAAGQAVPRVIRAADVRSVAPRVAPRAFGGRFGDASALQDVARLGAHLDGCAQEFWRSLGRAHGASMAAAMGGEGRDGG
jgi:predicted amidohydrolase YtcJ